MPAKETQLRILDAAERLFARRGFAATSLRNVTGEAGVNLAAVHYHFGSKEALIGAVFARRIGPLNDERLRLLDEAESRTAEGGAPSVETILETLVHPTARLARHEAGELSLLAGLLGRVHDESCTDVLEAVHEQFAAVSRRYLTTLARALPHLTNAELCTRFHFVVGTVASSLSDPHRLDFLSGGAVDARDMGTLTARLVTFLAAGLRAPVVEASNVVTNGAHAEDAP